jgi:hypothetical protein
MGKHPFEYGKAYLRAHRRHQKWFSGSIDPEGADAVAELVAATGASRILDYGCGKGYQYLSDRVHERWGGILPHCHDIGVWQLRERPQGLFDGVICTDVMEHIDEQDVHDIFRDVFSFLRTDRQSFAYFNIFCNDAGKCFPDGRNVHLTVKPPQWWRRIVKQHERDYLTIWVDYEYDCSNYMQR